MVAVMSEMFNTDACLGPVKFSKISVSFFFDFLDCVFEVGSLSANMLYVRNVIIVMRTEKTTHG